MKKLISLIGLSFMLLTVSLTLKAGELIGVPKIAIVHGHSSNWFYVAIPGATYTSKPACSNNAKNLLVATIASPDGANRLFSYLLSAEVSGKEVKIIGSGNCDAQSGYETLSYVDNRDLI